MFPFSDIVPAVVFSLFAVFINPLFWLVVGLVALQYRRADRARESFFGTKTRRLWRDTGISALLGLAGGLLGSLCMVFLGLTLADSGLVYLLPVAILLMLINFRFMCFAYAGGLLSLVSIVSGNNFINVTQVLALVAILHMVESLLILVSGHHGAVPAFFRDGQGNPVGGFTLQKFWPIPIVALAVVGQGAAPPGGIDMPQWWPLIKPGSGIQTENLIYAMLPVVAGLGYGDLAIYRSPAQKARLSAFYLFLYSLALLALALLTQYYSGLALVSALFSPLGHELVIYAGRRLETQGQPAYSKSARGLALLDVLVGSPGWRAGLRPGDVLLSVRGIHVYRRADLLYALGPGSSPVEIEYLHGRPHQYQRQVLPPLGPGETLGLLPVPEGDEQGYTEISTAGPFTIWWAGFKKRRQK